MADRAMYVSKHFAEGSKLATENTVKREPRDSDPRHGVIACEGRGLECLCMSYPLLFPRIRRPCGCRKACPHPARRPCSRCILAAGSRPLPLPTQRARAPETSHLRKELHYDADSLAAILRECTQKTASKAFERSLHLTDGACDFWPQQVNLLV